MVLNRSFKSLAFIFFLMMNAYLFSQETHRVEKNQTLYSISRLYGVSVEELKEWNGLSNHNIRLGQILKISLPQEKQSPESRAVGLSLDTHKIRYGDSLSTLAARYNTTVEELKRINGLQNTNIRTGQEIYIRMPRNLEFYTVEAGDHLSGLSHRFGLSLEELKKINNLRDASLRIGQTLRVAKPLNSPLTHEVREMDSLESIAYLYGKTVDELISQNSLSQGSVRTGQKLVITPFATANMQGIQERQGVSQEPSIVEPKIGSNSEPRAQNQNSQEEFLYKVQGGDTLWGLSRRYGTTAAKIIEDNSLNDQSLRIGQTLRISNSRIQEQASTTIALGNEVPQSGHRTTLEVNNAGDLSWESFVVLDKDIPLYEWNNDFYYWSHPGMITQPHRGYFESLEMTPQTAYERGTILFEKFRELVNKKTKVSNILNGITVVIDPGHGGLDPGAIVKSTDGQGDTLYVTEDEYVYDIALRMFVLLSSHGANVELTILAPNHLIRDTTPATKTLVHEKNEVFNSLKLNQDNDETAWPVGGTRGLASRVQVAGELFEKYPGTKRVFLSLHGDNSPYSPEGAGMLYYEDLNGRDEQGKTLAQHFVPFMGKNAYTRGQDLGVLRNNPGEYKLLIEVKNVAYKEQAWALRFANTRQMDALKIVQGLLEYFQ